MIPGGPFVWARANSDIEPRLDQAPGVSVLAKQIPESDSAAVLDDALKPAFLTEAQAAQYLNQTEHQLYLKRRNGGGPPFTMHGARVRYPFADLVEWAQNLPRFTSRAEAYVANPKRAEGAQRQRTATARARKTRWDEKPKRAKKRKLVEAATASE